MYDFPNHFKDRGILPEYFIEPMCIHQLSGRASVNKCGGGRVLLDSSEKGTPSLLHDIIEDEKRVLVSLNLYFEEAIRLSLEDFERICPDFQSIDDDSHNHRYSHRRT